MTNDGPSPREVALTTAMALERDGRWLEAAEHYAALMIRFPARNFGLPRHLLDVSLRGGRNIAEAYAALARVTESWEQNGYGIAALSAWKWVSAGRPDDPEPYLSAAEACARCGIALDSRAYYQRAYDAYLRRGDAAAARALKERVAFSPADLDAEFASATLTLADLAFERGEIDAAAETYGQVAERVPDNVEAHEGLRKCHLSHARFDDAAKLSRILADIHRRAGDSQRAQAADREADRLRPLNPALWIERGAAQEKQGAFPAAASAYREAVRLDPRRADAWFGLGGAYHWLVNRTGVLECHRRLMEVDPTRADAFQAEFVDAERHGEPRRLVFPPNCQIGSLSVRDSRTGWDLEWRLFARARGEVLVPPCQHVRLKAESEERHDLAPLAALSPSDLDELDLSDTEVRDDDLRHLAHLTGLRRLSLAGSDMACSGVLSDTTLGIGMPVAAVGMLWDGHGVTGAGLVHLRRLTRIEELDLSTSGIGDDGMVYLAGMSRLRVLNLGRTTVGDSGLAALSPLSTLRTVRLEDTRITDPGLSRFLERQADLSLLSVSGTSIEGEGLLALPRPDRLHSLDVGRSPIEASHLWHFTALRHLRLTGTLITDADLADVAALTELRVLDLADTEITDAGLEHLAKLRRLERLEVMGSRVTDAGLDRLRTRLGRPALKATLKSSWSDWFDRL